MNSSTNMNSQAVPLVGTYLKEKYFYLLFKNWMVLFFKNWVYPKLDEIEAESFRRKRIFNFCYIFVISPWKWMWPFIWTNGNSLHHMMLCAKFGWNWPSRFGEEDQNVKSLQTDRRSEKLAWTFSSGMLKSKPPIMLKIE